MARAPSVEPTRPCPDPECVDAAGHRSLAEPEQDGEVGYHQCPTCGYAFGYHRLTPTLSAVKNDGTCAVGIPEPLRRAASAGMHHALADAAPAPLLQIGHRPDAAT